MCGRLEILDPQSAVSTTARFREIMMDGASGFAEHVLEAVEEAVQTYFKKAGRPFEFRQKEK